MKESASSANRSEWLTRQREMSPQKLLEAYPELSQDEWLESFLQELEIDTQVIADIIEELLEPAGVADRSLVPHDRMFNLSTDTQVRAAYSSISNAIYLNLSRLDTPYTGLFLAPGGVEARAKMDYDPRVLEKLVPLHVYLHEQLHAVSDQGGNSSSTPLIKKHLNQVGFVEQEFYSVGARSVYVKTPEENSVNEGMTEFFSKKVLEEYVRRLGSYKGAGVEDVQTYFRVGEKEKVLPYWEEAAQAREMIELLTEVVDVPRNTIEEALTCGYFKEGKLLSSELESLFIENGHETVYRELQSWFGGEAKDAAA